MRILHFSSVNGGNPYFESAYRSWIGDPTVDIALHAYAGSDAARVIRPRPKFWSEGPGLKFQNLLKFIDQHTVNVLDSYTHVAVADDDLVYYPPHLKDLAALMQRFNSPVGSPANSGHTDWPIMKRKPVRLQLTNFVEVGFMVFEVEALKRFLPALTHSGLSDWGIDLLTSSHLFSPETPFLIYHERPYYNPKRSGRDDLGIAEFQLVLDAGFKPNEVRILREF